MSEATESAHAHLIVADADVWCGDAARRRARAIAIRGDRVVAVGTDDDVRAFRGPATEVVSLPGRMVVPGFQDAHVHPSVGARNLLNVNLDDLHTKDDYLARIAHVADSNPDLEWIVGGGWYGPVFAETDGPRKEDLDAIVPDRPVFLLNTDVHGAWVNSKALEAAGITASTPDPWDGYFVRDPDGSPTGTLQEGAAYDVLRTVACATERRAVEDLPAACAAGAARARHHRVAGRLGRARPAARLPRARRRGRADGPRGGLDVVGPSRRHRAGRPARRAARVGDRRHARRRTRSRSCSTGAPRTAPARCSSRTRARSASGTTGASSSSTPRCSTEALVALDARGFQVHQHALGDRAFRSALDAIEAARAANGWNDARHHIAHCSCPTPPTFRVCDGSAWSRTCSRTGRSPTPRSASSRRRGWGPGVRVALPDRRSCARAAR